MDKSEVEKLFALLAELYPRQRQPETDKRLYAWELALEPYKYEEIRAAALEHARKSQYFPSIAEITENLPKPDRNAWMDKYIDDRKNAGGDWQHAIDAGKCRDAADELGSVSRYARENGVSWREAKEKLQGEEQIMVYIGIDPGKSGAMAIIHQTVNAPPTIELYPFDEEKYRERLAYYGGKCRSVKGCVLERVGAMPGQGVTSMFSFGTNYGFIRGLLAAFDVPHELVLPRAWKREFGVTADKNTAVEVAQRLFPSTSFLRTDRCKKPDDGFAEALLMAEYARRKMGGGAA